MESLYRLLHIVLFILLYRLWSLDTCSSLSFTVVFVRLFRDYDFSNIRSAFFLLIDGLRFAVTVEHGLSIVYGYIQAKECAVHKAEEDILGVYFQMQFPQVTPIFSCYQLSSQQIDIFFFLEDAVFCYYLLFPQKFHLRKLKSFQPSFGTLWYPRFYFLIFTIFRTILFLYISYHHFHLPYYILFIQLAYIRYANA